MSCYVLTAEHWQAALEVPKQIALDLTAPLNLRLQAVRMVQAMLKVILKEEKERDAPKSAAKSAKPSEARPSSLPAASETDAHQNVNIAPVGADAAEEAIAKEDRAALTASPQPEEVRPRYIGRAGPRNIRNKRKH
ncbi:hypothetical protein DTL42_04490 [Bremerella cremea]|uniref:Uncharacterized protein n=1 Tax=Bremerella cremea TaxID=1031537 RepID=A0A368KVR6_9BACT|nr:hypothetical protein [Bremerella cremea]RCS54411.1 hypothetical protein DTL42_04490 [Bremerella cremea]